MLFHHKPWVHHGRLGRKNKDGIKPVPIGERCKNAEMAGLCNFHEENINLKEQNREQERIEMSVHEGSTSPQNLKAVNYLRCELRRGVGNVVEYYFRRGEKELCHLEEQAQR